jgi:DNA-binding response OmpR family regulator
MKVLIADDDYDLLSLIAFTLEQAGFFVIKASEGKVALQQFIEQCPDLVLLDINMPNANGFEVCARIREQSSVPVMMLTVRGEEEDLVKALELGADDYLNKPFSPRTLIARVKALLRRAGAEAVATPIKVGQLRLNVEEHTVRVGDQEPLRLTKLETRLLQMLLAHPGHTITSERLLMQVWGHKGAGDRQLLKQLVHRVRQKIEADPSVPQFLQTIPGAGYKLAVE